MALNNRYLPSHPAGQSCQYAIDLSAILPPGVTVQSGTLVIQLNTVPPAPSSDFTIGAVSPNGRRLYANLAGGASATDYRLTWTATDSLGNIWPRACLLLCAATS